MTIFSGMRKEDLYSTRSIDVTNVRATSSCGRHFSFCPMCTKNDRMGTGDPEGRIFRVPCVCAARLKGKELTNFKESIAMDPLFQCPCVYPFDVVQTYLSLIPDASGLRREKERETDPTLRSLKFMRAIATGKLKRFTLEPRGICMLHFFV